MSTHRVIRHVLGSALVASVAVTSVAASAQLPVRPTAVRTHGTALAHPAAVSATVSILHSFNGTTDGANPQGALSYGVSIAGNRIVASLLGETQLGGAAGDGTTFAQNIAPNASFASRFAFAGANGMTPAGGLANFLVGPMLGVTQFGGKYGMGEIFETTANGAQTVLYSFTGAADGANPVGKLLYFNGVVYGTTSAGAAGYGTIFKYTPSGLRTLHTFSGIDGSAPLAGLSVRVSIPASNTAARNQTVANGAMNPAKAAAQYIDPALYGTTSSGGAGGNGTIFKITPAGTFTNLVSFDNTVVLGSAPSAELSPDLSGNLYGTTADGGSAGVGEIFAYNPTSGFKVLHDFGFDPNAGVFPDGANPLAPVTVTLNGNLYGTTSGGSFYGLGNVWEISSAGFALKYEFGNPAVTGDGAIPQGALLEAPGSVLYGTTNGGGVNGLGTIFKIAE